MCGIFGFLLNRPLEGTDLERGRRATAMLEHRGSEGSGEWMDVARGVYLGHTRLAILDRSEANAQPLSRGGLTLSYNGEIYNFVELREELEAAGYPGMETLSPGTHLAVAGVVSDRPQAGLASDA